jgi:hypothetical protein
LQWEEALLDGSFAPVEKGSLQSEKPSVARAQSGWYWSTVKVFRWKFGWKVPPRGEVTLAEATLGEVRVPRPKDRPRQKPKPVIADRAYDSDPLRQRLKMRAIDLIVRYRDNNKLRRMRMGGNCDAAYFVTVIGVFRKHKTRQGTNACRINKRVHVEALMSQQMTSEL